MATPLEISMQNVDASPAVEAAIREKTAKLERFADRLLGVRVRVDAPHRRHGKGKLYSVCVELQVPGGHIVASRDPAEHHSHEDVYVAVRDAFNAAARQLQDLTRVRRGDVKHHDSPQRDG